MSHLQLVRGRYRLRIVVPPPLRAIIGKEALVQGLATSHHAHAMRLAALIIAAFKARLADAASRANYRPKLRVHPYTRVGFQHPGSEWYADAYSLIGPTGEVIIGPVNVAPR